MNNRDSDNSKVIEAIERSVRTNAVAHAEASAGIVAALRASCADWVANGRVLEYWGTTEAGGDWRVHVILN